MRVHSRQRLEHLARALPRPDQRAREHARGRVERELERGHRAEAPAAAAQRPEQLGLALGGRRRRTRPSAVTTSIAEHAVGGEAVAAAEPAQAAAERVADHADVRRGARQRSEPELGRRLRDVHPQRARPHVGAAARRVDVDAAHARTCAAARCRRAARATRVVPGALYDDAQADARGRSARHARRHARSWRLRPSPGAGRRRGSTRGGPRPSWGRRAARRARRGRSPGARCRARSSLVSWCGGVRRGPRGRSGARISARRRAAIMHVLAARVKSAHRCVQ